MRVIKVVILTALVIINQSLNMESRGKVAEHFFKCYRHLEECRRALAELESALLAASAKAAIKRRPSPLQRLGVRRKAVEPSHYNAPPQEEEEPESEEEGIYETTTKLEELTFSEKRQMIGSKLSSLKKKK